jgi:hypothetical protein
MDTFSFYATDTLGRFRRCLSREETPHAIPDHARLGPHTLLLALDSALSLSFSRARYVQNLHLGNPLATSSARTSASLQNLPSCVKTGSSAAPSTNSQHADIATPDMVSVHRAPPLVPYKPIPSPVAFHASFTTLSPLQDRQSETMLSLSLSRR